MVGLKLSTPFFILNRFIKKNIFLQFIFKPRRVNSERHSQNNFIILFIPNNFILWKILKKVHVNASVFHT